MRREIKSFMYLLFLFLFAGQSDGQIPFSKGVNLTNWFQAANARQIEFTKYTKDDFIHIKSLGCDVVRLPINMHYMTNGSPDYIFDPIFFTFLDSVVNWAEDLQICLLLDDHTFDPVANTDPGIGSVLTKVWPQIAGHYKNRSNYIYYEILNEPHGITTQTWGAIQQTVIDSIRKIDRKHTIIVGASGYNTYSEMQNLPVYTDTNLIYTFHFYDPFVFTHQGASWSSPSMEPLSGVPFPYNSSTMPSCPASLKGTWIEGALNNYYVDGTVAKVKSLIDIAVNFKNNRHVKVFCGEFGVYIPNSNDTDRVYWYDVVSKYLQEKIIPWTIWDYQGGFGLFKKGSNELFDYDLNIDLLQALGFNIPPQNTYVARPDSIGFMMYSDYIEKNIFESSYGSSIIDYYCLNKPNNGDRCLYWTGADQYSVIGFDFKPDKDLSKLDSENYSIDFFIRGDSPGTKFDIRFLDTKTDAPGDHPWRMRATIDDSYGPWDKHWHHVHIPLKNFTEHGAWDNNTWWPPQGLFDWKAVDRFEIDAEYFGMTGRKTWFDNIQITNLDTATVLDTSEVTASVHNGPIETCGLKAFPNPMNGLIFISYNLPVQDQVELSVYNLEGQKIYSILNEQQSPGPHSIAWYGNNYAGSAMPAGIFLCRLTTGSINRHIKIIKL